MLECFFMSSVSANQSHFVIYILDIEVFVIGTVASTELPTSLFIRTENKVPTRIISIERSNSHCVCNRISTI